MRTLLETATTDIDARLSGSAISKRLRIDNETGVALPRFPVFG